jgi:hypothetical protein
MLARINYKVHYDFYQFTKPGTIWRLSLTVNESPDYINVDSVPMSDTLYTGPLEVWPIKREFVDLIFATKLAEVIFGINE